MKPLAQLAELGQVVEGEDLLFPFTWCDVRIQYDRFVSFVELSVGYEFGGVPPAIPESFDIAVVLRFDQYAAGGVGFDGGGDFVLRVNRYPILS